MAPRILIVDDEPHICLMMSRALENEEFEIETASGGADAIKKINVNLPDVLVTDLQMPEIDGRMLCDMIESKFGNKIRLIIVMTARTNNELREWALERGNTIFLEKPVSPRNLLEKINSNLA